MAAASSRGQGGGHGRGRGRGRAASNSTRGSSVPLIDKEPLSDAPEIISDEDCQVLEKEQEEKKTRGKQTAKCGRPYRAQPPVRKIESPVKPCTVQLNQAECDNNCKKKIAKKSERKEEKALVKQNIKEPTKVSTEVEEPKQIEQSEKPVDVKENSVENDVNLGIVKGETPEERAKRMQVIQDSFTIKCLEDEIDKVLTTRTEMKNTKDRIERLKAVLALLSQEDAVVQFEYVDKEEAETNDRQNKEFKTVMLEHEGLKCKTRGTK